MKEEFFHHYPPEQDTLESLWQNAIIAIDSSVLLNLYGLSKDTLGDVLTIWDEHRDRLYLPYQVVEEYQFRRPSVIREQLGPIDEVEKKLQEVKERLESRKQQPFVESAVLRGFVDSIDNINNSLQRHREQLRQLVKRDTIREKLDDIFRDSVGKRPSEEWLKRTFSEGKDRYARKIPPGFKDDKKPEPICYGDLVVWKQAIEASTDRGQGLIFLCDDLKEDWWQKDGEDLLWPHPSLRKEFREHTGQDVHFYSMDRFVELAKEKGAAVSQESLDELEHLRHNQLLKNKESHQRGLMDSLIGDATSSSKEYGINSALGKLLSDIEKHKKQATEQYIESLEHSDSLGSVFSGQKKYGINPFMATDLFSEKGNVSSGGRHEWTESGGANEADDNDLD